MVCRLLMVSRFTSLPVSKTFDWFLCYCWNALFNVKALLSLSLVTNMLLDLLGFSFHLGQLDILLQLLQFLPSAFKYPGWGECGQSNRKESKSRFEQLSYRPTRDSDDNLNGHCEGSWGDCASCHACSQLLPCCGVFISYKESLYVLETRFYKSSY